MNQNPYYQNWSYGYTLQPSTEQSRGAYNVQYPGGHQHQQGGHQHHQGAGGHHQAQGVNNWAQIKGIYCQAQGQVSGLNSLLLTLVKFKQL